MSSAKQLVVVTTPGWDSTTGELRRFTRDDPRSPWRPEGNAVPIVVGRTGLAWGVGFDRFAEGAERHKQEGDGRSPAGTFPLDTAFGFAPADSMPWVRLPYLQLTSTTDCVDDTGSMHYNEVLDRSAVARVDWQSAERMRQIGVYRLGVIIGFNTAPTTRARGSCVFFHIWGGPRSHTAGCTAMDAAELERLVAWLDPDARPVVVQVPAAVYPRVRGGWGLPELAIPDHGVIGVGAEHLQPDRVILTPAAIGAAQPAEIAGLARSVSRISRARMIGARTEWTRGFFETIRAVQMASMGNPDRLDGWNTGSPTISGRRKVPSTVGPEADLAQTVEPPALPPRLKECEEDPELEEEVDPVEADRLPRPKEVRRAGQDLGHPEPMTTEMRTIRNSNRPMECLLEDPVDLGVRPRRSRRWRPSSRECERAAWPLDGPVDPRETT
ncbi:MAG: hypothetical protein Q8N53_18400 [Longimicrobiales bacterium]|nr:hypothetical protein [Longimicrobiales bacterium]